MFSIGLCLHNMANFFPIRADIGSDVWGTPANLSGFRVLASLLQPRRSPEASQTLKKSFPSENQVAPGAPSPPWIRACYQWQGKLHSSLISHHVVVKNLTSPTFLLVLHEMLCFWTIRKVFSTSRRNGPGLLRGLLKEVYVMNYLACRKKKGTWKPKPNENWTSL